MDSPRSRSGSGGASRRLRLLRVHEIDRRIRAGGYPNAATLAEALEVSSRTIQRDLEFLRDAMGAPLEYDAGERGYRYTEPSFTLPAVELCDSEIVALDTARRYLERLRDSALGEELASLLRKLEDCAGVSAERRARPAETLLPVPQARASSTEYEKVRRAVRERRVLRCRYRSGSSGELERRLDPYDLLFWDGAWYVVGRCHLHDEPRIFALTRMREAAVTELRFDPPADWSLERFLSGAFALFVAPAGVEPEAVRLRFRGYAARYVSERRWHRSQRLEELEGGGVRLSMTLPVTPALERFVLGWGDEVVVEGPGSLARRIAERLDRARAAYRSPSQ